MKRGICVLITLAIAVSFFGCSKSQTAKKDTIEIVISREANNLEQFAASQLQDYLQKLFGFSAEINSSPSKNAGSVFVLGNPQNNPHLKKALNGKSLELTDQGFYIGKTTLDGAEAMIIAGGSGKATMWGVYELIERYGVTYLLHEDVFPVDVGEFNLPQIDKTFEPVLKVRQWRFLNEHAMGPISWGMDDYRRVLGQLAKMKFNRILAMTWTSQPFLHFEYKGIKRSNATLFFGRKFPLTDDMPGRKFFDDRAEFWNPDLPLNGSYEEFSAAGEKLCHNLIALAHDLGMEACFAGDLVTYPKDFESVVPQAVTVEGTLDISPGPDVMPDDPELIGLAGAVLRTTIETYPEADLYSYIVPEFRYWTKQYEWAWEKLDAKYNINEIMTSDEPVKKASKRVQSYGGAERSINEVKGDLVALYFYDKLFNDPEILSGTKKPNPRIVISHIARELFPILHLVFPKNAETRVFIGYTASSSLENSEVLGTIRADKVPAKLIFTLHDDNVGVMPQLVTGALSKLTHKLIEYGWAGYSTRFWMISDHDLCAAYLAKASWDKDVTVKQVYTDQITKVCGPAAVEPLLEVFQKLEVITADLETNAESVAFPVENMMLKHYHPDAFTETLATNRQRYKDILAILQNVPQLSRPEAKAYVDYWIGRIEFGIGYLDTIEQLSKAAEIEADGDKAKAAGDMEMYKMTILMTAMQIKQAQKTAYKALETFAKVAKDNSDLGAIATMAEYLCRDLDRHTVKILEKTKIKGEK